MNQKKAPCTVVLIAVNTAVFLALSFIGMTEDAGFMLQHGAMYAPDILYNGKYYELFTSMFLHFGFQHLMSNMISLGVMGWQLESAIGRIRYLLIYLLSGIGGNLLSLAADIHGGEYVVSAGASGAIFGIIGALLYIAIRNYGRVGSVSGRGIVFMIIITFYYGYSNTGVDNYAHIGGLISGFLLAVILYHKSGRKKGTRSQ